MPGLAKITVRQIKLADEEIFLSMAQLTRAGLGNDANGEPVLNKVLTDLAASPRIAALLNQIPGAGGAGRQGDPIQRENKAEKRLAQENQSLKAKIKKMEQHSSSKGGGKASGGKGGGKGQYSRREAGNMPRELLGMEKSIRGKPICFGYNCRSGCTNSTDSQRMCPKGKHVCARKGCGGDHPAFSDLCPKRE